VSGINSLLNAAVGANPVLHSFHNYESATQCYTNCTDEELGRFACYTFTDSVGGEVELEPSRVSLVSPFEVYFINTL
jgi:hypothetical protein